MKKKILNLPLVHSLILPHEKWFMTISYLKNFMFYSFSDVIGAVENFEKVTKIPTRFGERDIVRFKLCDARL